MANRFQELTSEDFIARLSVQVRRGFGITPFAGSGISSRSGIIMGIEFSEYLTYTVFRSVVREEEQGRLLNQPPPRLWNARHDGWPESPKPFEVDVVRKWVAEEYKRLCEDCGVAVAQNEDHTVHFLSLKFMQEGGEPATLDTQIRRPLLPAILKSENTIVNDQAVKDFLRAVGNEGAARGQIYRSGISVDSQEGLVERAIRSLHDWRATLHFLAELDVIESDNRTRPFLTHHDPGVIDSFNTHITWGRKPNLAHSMLAHLADPMRTRLVLTTNFDTLIEDAFAQLAEPLKVIPVGLHANLPSPHTVHAQNTLVKLHGALTDTRADFSLDDVPSPTDQSRFFHYVVGGQPPRTTSSPLLRELQKQPPPFLSTHLLVIGFAGGDSRILRMMKFLLDHCPATKLFWICFNQGDLDAMPKLFPEVDYAHRLEVTVTDRADLLLLELHQKLTGSLPRGGFSYQFSHDVPPKLWKIDRATKKSGDKSTEEVPGPGEGGKGGEGIAERVIALSKSISQEAAAHRRQETDLLRKAISDPKLKLLKRCWHNQSKILVADTESGLMAVLKEAFDFLKRKRFSCIWMEMEDYANPQELAHGLLQIVALRRGLFQLEHAVLMPTRFDEFLTKDKEMENDKGADHNARTDIPDGGSHAWRERFFRLGRYLGIQKEKWVIFFYGRNVPGICSGWDLSPWGEDQYKEFHPMLDGLAANGFQIVYAPYSSRRWSDDNTKANETREVERDLRAQGIHAGQADAPDVAPGGFPAHLWDADKVNKEWIDVVLENRLKEQRAEQLSFTGARDQRPQYETVSVDPVPSTAHYIDTLLPYFRDQIIKPLFPQKGEPARGEVLRAQFLYACSLFRRSRPMSAFLSEGVFPPLNTKLDGLDDDWSRQEQGETWVTSFREKGFVWRKPGGNIWLYRDARLGMQSLLQKCRNFPVWSSGKPVPLPAAYQMRAGTHFWVAAWYMRAFFTTNHSVPLIEALHHLFRSLEYARFAERPEPASEEQRSTYRRQIWIRSLTSMIKLLKVGRTALLFWMDRPAAEAMFSSEKRKHVREQIADSQKHCFPDSSPPEVALHAEDLERLFFAEWEMLWSEFTRRPFQSEFGSHRRDETGPKTTYPMLHLFAETTDWRTRPADTTPAHLGPEWLEALKNHEAGKTQDDDLRARLRELGDVAGRQHLGKDSLPHLIQALERLAYDHVRRAKICELRNLHDGPVDKDLFGTLPGTGEVRRLWAEVSILCRAVMSLCRSVPPHLLDFEYSTRVNCGTLYGLALGRLSRFTQAHRSLNEANARLSKLPRRVDQVELAVTELRRAEVYLAEAIFVGHLVQTLVWKLEKWGTEVSPTESIDHLLSWMLRLTAVNKDAFAPSTLRITYQWWCLYDLAKIARKDQVPAAFPKGEERRTFRTNLVRHLSRIHVAKLDDAWVALEQAERLLSGRSRSPQWWGRLCALRLKVFAAHWSEEETFRFHRKTDDDQWTSAPERGSQLAYSSMAIRRKIDYREYMVSLLRVGLAVWPDDTYRRLRLADYFMRAWKRHYLKEKPSTETRTLLIEALETGPNSLDDRLQIAGQYGILNKYRNSVMAQVEHFVGA